MKDHTDIISLALQQPLLPDQLAPAGTEEAGVKDAFSYELQRFTYPQAWPLEDVGVISYSPGAGKRAASLQLRYCMVGNRYCSNPACKNSGCAMAAQAGTAESAPMMDVISITLHPRLISAFGEKNLATLFDAEVASPLVKTITPCSKSKLAMEQMVHHPYEGILKNIFLQSKALELLLYSSDQFIRHDPDEKYGCRFLTHEDDRQKIMRAREILLEHLDSPVTIKELARKVAINECYLKKGFKAMFGTTIYDYFQKERMERAKHLLYERSLSVSEVAMMLGYSCISHFSTAFKKHTGLKPCELLR